VSKFNSQQSNFSSGELSPKLEGRSDIKEYKDGLALLENFTTINSGGVTKRPGARYIATLANTIAPVIIPFIVDKETAYIVVLEINGAKSLGADAIRIYNNNGVVQTISKVFNGFSEDLDKHGFYWTQSADILFVTHVSGLMPPFMVLRVPSDTPQFVIHDYNDRLTSLNVLGASFNTPITNQLKVPYTDTNVNGDILFNPNATGGTTLAAEDAGASALNYFTSDHIGTYFRLDHAGVEGICVVTDVGGLKQTITTTATTDIFTKVGHGYVTGNKLYFSISGGNSPVPVNSFTIVADTSPRFPYYVIRIDDDTFYIATTSANATAGTRVDITTAHTGTLSAHLADGTKVSSCTVITKSDFGAATATDNWRESSWSNYKGWPRTCAIYESRLCWAGSPTYPDTVWLSLTGNLFFMMSEKLTQDASSAVSNLKPPYFGPKVGIQPLFFALGGDEIPLIQWMSSDTLLQVGTLSQEYIIGDAAKAIEATDVISSKTQTTHGGRDVKAIRAYNSVVFVGRDGKKVRTYKYNNKNGSYISQNLNILSDDMIMSLGAPATGTGTETFSNVSVKQLAHQQSKNILWILTSRNKLISLTFAEETETVAWSRHEVGGSDVFIHGITSIPSSDGDTDDLWMVVQRTINSATVYYLEKMGDDFSHRNLSGNFSNDNDFPWFSDSSIRVTDFGNAKITWPVAHLEGETVKVLADGILQADQTVTGGNITIDTAAEEIIVGLSYTAKLNTLDLEAGADSETSKGNKQRIDRVALNLFNSFGGKMGGKASKIHTLKYRTTASNPLYTGILTQTIPADTGEDSRVYLEHSDPLPFTVLAMTVRGKSYD